MEVNLRKGLELMKKKLLSLLLIVLMLAFGMQTEAFASENSELYASISSITSTMSINDSILDYSVDVITRGADYVDTVHIDAELRTVDGRVIKPYSEDLEASNRVFTFSKRDLCEMIHMNTLIK